MQIIVPRTQHNAVCQRVGSVGAFGGQDSIEAVVHAVVFTPRRDERGVRLAVGVNQQYTTVGCACTPQYTCQTERNIRGGRRFADAPFMLCKHKNPCLLPFLLHRQIE
jgi:hypothetical protein